MLEVGPGQGSLHLELRRRVKGPVDVVERSAVFAAQLARACRRDGFGPGRVWETDLINALLPRAAYDLIFVRWVFLFLPNPDAHIRKLVRALKPEGILAIQDYHRETLAMVPRPPEWTRLILADLAFFASQGGDASIGGRLPHMPGAQGSRSTTLWSTVKTGHRDRRDVALAVDRLPGHSRSVCGVSAVHRARCDAAPARVVRRGSRKDVPPDRARVARRRGKKAPLAGLC